MEILTMELIRYTVYNVWNPIVMILCGIVCLLSFIFFLIYFEDEENVKCFISITLFLLSIAAAIGTMTNYNSTKKEMGYHKYQVLIDTMTREEIEQNYIIIEQNGKLYTLQDKEHFEVE